jgi:hypothetical protein
MACICLTTGWRASLLFTGIPMLSPSPETSTRKSRHSCESLPPDGRRIVSWCKEPRDAMIDFYAAAGTYPFLSTVFTRRRSVRFLASVSRHVPSWKRIASSSAKSTRTSRRRTSARTGWAIRQAADPRLVTPMVTLPNSSPASFCGLSKKARRNISRLIVFAKSLGSRPRPLSRYPDDRHQSPTHA